MGSTCLQFHFHQGVLLVLFESAIDRNRRFSQFVVSNRLQQTLSRVRTQWGVDQFCGRLRKSVNDGEVPLAYGSLFKLLHEPPMGGFIFGRHHDSACVTVQPMHDSRSRMILAYFGKFTVTSVLEVPGQGVDQGARLVPFCRMHQEPGWLVEHDDVLVFVKYFKVMMLGGDIRAWWGGKKHREAITLA